MNVDRSIRILEIVCCDDFNQLSEAEKENLVQEFYQIDNKQKPVNFRNLSLNEIRSIFDKLNVNLKNKISEDFNKSHISIKKKPSNNNKYRADALIVFTDHSIIDILDVEFKFGHETLANIGNNKMDQIFYSKNYSNIFRELNKKICSHQRQLIDNGIDDTDELVAKLRQYLISLCDEINQMDLEINLEELEKVIHLTGSRDSGQWIIKYLIQPQEIKNVTNSHINQNWELKHIRVLNDVSKARIEIIVINNTNKVKFLLNWKNNYIYPKRSGIKRQAKTGGTCSSWNVWIFLLK